MLPWLRLLGRSSGTVVAVLVLLGMAFYGIALLSVMFVDDPARGLQVLGVFLLLSTVFCLLLRWVVLRAVAQARRPFDSAREATTRLAAMGGQGGRMAVRALGERIRGAGSFAGRTLGAAFRAAGRVAGSAFRARRRNEGGAVEGEETSRSAPVVPLPRGRRLRAALPVGDPGKGSGRGGMVAGRKE